MIRQFALLLSSIPLLIPVTSFTASQSQPQQPAAQPQLPLSKDPQKQREFDETRANILMARKQYSEAIPIYLRLLQQEKDARRRATLYNRIGIAYQQQGMFNPAKRNYDRAVKADADRLSRQGI